MPKNLIACLVFSLSLISVANCVQRPGNPDADQASETERTIKGEVLVTNRLDIDFSKHLITFIELGADKCIPCRQMQPIMKEIAAEYPDQVLVVFYDVWKNPAPAEYYKIQLIPTQVFIDKRGNELFRHVGFFPKEDILKFLRGHGVK
jgi:thioredoxin 1